MKKYEIFQFQLLAPNALSGWITALHSYQRSHSKPIIEITEMPLVEYRRFYKWYALYDDQGRSLGSIIVGSGLPMGAIKQPYDTLGPIAPIHSGRSLAFQHVFIQTRAEAQQDGLRERRFSLIFDTVIVKYDSKDQARFRGRPLNRNTELRYTCELWD